MQVWPRGPTSGNQAEASCPNRSLPLPEYECNACEDDQSFNCVVTFNGVDYFSNQKSKKLGEQDLASQIIANLNLS